MNIVPHALGKIPCSLISAQEGLELVQLLHDKSMTMSEFKGKRMANMDEHIQNIQQIVGVPTESTHVLDEILGEASVSDRKRVIENSGKYHAIGQADKSEQVCTSVHTCPRLYTKIFEGVREPPDFDLSKHALDYFTWLGDLNSASPYKLLVAWSVYQTRHRAKWKPVVIDYDILEIPADEQRVVILGQTIGIYLNGTIRSFDTIRDLFSVL